MTSQIYFPSSRNTVMSTRVERIVLQTWFHINLFLGNPLYLKLILSWYKNQSYKFHELALELAFILLGALYCVSLILY